MAFIYEYYTNSYWSQDDPGVKTLIGVKNSGSLNAVIEKIYIQNYISNYQEDNCIENFCIHISDVNYNSVSTIGIAQYNIPYPNYYPYRPGNIEYNNIGVLPSSNYYYKSLMSFTLTPSETFSFYLNFNPRNIKIDFYIADLVVDYVIDGENFTRRLTHKIKANYISSINSVDGKSFPDVAIQINGIDSSGILIIQ